MVKQYHEGLIDVLTEPDSECVKDPRTGVYVIERFGGFSKYDLREGFPLLTTKFVPLRLVFIENEWFLKGRTDLNFLVERNANFWNDNAFDFHMRRSGRKLPEFYTPDYDNELKEFINDVKNGMHVDLGPTYGSSLRRWRSSNENTVDQISNAIKTLKSNPQSRRIKIVTWNPAEVDNVALPWCHGDQIYHTDKTGKYIDLKMDQRSIDKFLGEPFNIAGHALHLHIMAKECNLTPRYFIHTKAHDHIYCGRGERGKFYEDNLDEIKNRVLHSESLDDLLSTAEWIEKSSEDPENLDHVTAALRLLARPHRTLPRLEILKKPFSGENNEFVLDFNDVKLTGYDPDKRKLERRMAV